MRVLRRFPALEPLLRDGRLCLSTVTMLAPLLTDDNFVEVTRRAEYRSKSEVAHLVASIQPRPAPRDGIRRVSNGEAERTPGAASSAGASGAPERHEGWAPSAHSAPTAGFRLDSVAAPGRQSADFDRAAAANQPPSPGQPCASGQQAASSGHIAAALDHEIAAALPHHAPEAAVPDERLFVPAVAQAPRRSEVTPVSRDEWSLRVTIDAEMKAGLETLQSLLSHKSGGNLAAVLREAIRCGVEKHGKRRGAVSPDVERARGRSSPHSGAVDRAIPAAVRREVWRRDQGCCQWRGKDGRRCGSKWKLEIDHVIPVARGGRSVPDNLRILCRSHNALHAEQVFGRRHMSKFAGRAGSRRGSATSPSPRAPSIPGSAIAPRDRVPSGSGTAITPGESAARPSEFAAAPAESGATPAESGATPAEPAAASTSGSADPPLLDAPAARPTQLRPRATRDPP
jgi:5-methylcytosine-specific restriction endonuclease McrA